MHLEPARQLQSSGFANSCFEFNSKLFLLAGKDGCTAVNTAQVQLPHVGLC